MDVNIKMPVKRIFIILLVTFCIVSVQAQTESVESNQVTANTQSMLRISLVISYSLQNFG